MIAIMSADAIPSNLTAAIQCLYMYFLNAFAS